MVDCLEEFEPGVFVLLVRRKKNFKFYKVYTYELVSFCHPEILHFLESQFSLYVTQSIGGFREGLRGHDPFFSCIFKMFFPDPNPSNRFFFSCCYNYTIRLKWNFHSRGRVGDSAPSFWIFWIHPCKGPKKFTIGVNLYLLG